MAIATAKPDQPFHVRSISMPFRSHPTMLKVDEELRKLKACVVSPLAAEMCNGVRGVGKLYGSINDLLHLQSMQQSFFHPKQKKWLEKELDLSLRLLDLCSTTKDVLASVNECIQDLQSTLRRKGESASEETLRACMRSNKEAQKKMRKCEKEMKQLESKCGLFPHIGEDSDMSVAVRVLVEAREITVSLLRSVLSFLLMPSPKPRASRWFSVTKSIHKIKVGCQDEFSSTENVDGISKPINPLKAFSVRIQDLQTGLDSLFRRQIQNRVSLLNMLSL